MSLPNLSAGMAMKETKRPFLGRLRSNLQAALFNAVMNLRIERGTNDQVFITSNAIVLQLKRSVAGVAGNSLSVHRFKIVSIELDYTVCHLFDDEEGDDEILIAKPSNAWASPANALAGGIIWDVDFADSNSRNLSTTTPDAELNQSMTPAYGVGGIIFAVRVENSGVVAAPDFLEIAPHRHWQTDLVEVDLCVDVEGTPTLKKILIHGSEAYDA